MHDTLSVTPTIQRRFRAIAEASPGPKLDALWQRHWPAYRRWFLRDGEAARPSYAETRRMLGVHMPELLPTYETLTERVGGSDLAARFLGLYCPTPFFAACSQAVWTRGDLALIRNYDYPPQAYDAVVLNSCWNGTRVLASVDCLWGVLDGMNEHGLAVSLAFGGRRVVGKGFGIALILRYILEFCRDAGQALAVLKRVPVQLAYNVAVLDRTGRYFTAAIGPDRAPEITPLAVSTNQQRGAEWHEYAEFCDTDVRQQFLDSRIGHPDETLASMLRHFSQEPPLYRPVHRHGWGTLYTACYLPAAGAVEYRWPRDGWRQSFARFEEGERALRYWVDPSVEVNAA